MGFLIAQRIFSAIGSHKELVVSILSYANTWDGDYCDALMHVYQIWKLSKHAEMYPIGFA